MNQDHLPLHYRSALQLADAIARRELSSQQVTRHFLERMARAQKLHAYSVVLEAQAMAQAQEADRLLDTGVRLSALHGVPIAIKDSIEWEGVSAMAGSLTRRDTVSTHTSAVVQRLLASGMVILGKTHMTEFAFGLSGQNQTLGTAWNPWDTGVQRAPGGSSSGAGVAVAAGLAPIALGGDTGGSVRAPATLNHLVGYKPSSGLISRAGCVPLSETLDVLGPISRTVEDAHALTAILSFPDVNDPLTLGLAASVFPNLRPWTAQGAAPLLVLDPAAWPAALSAAAQQVWEAALARLQGAGHTLQRWMPPADFTFAQLGDDNSRLLGYEGHRYYAALARDPKQPLWSVVRARILAGGTLSEEGYQAVCARRGQASASFARAMHGFEALLMPACDQAAQPLDDPDTVHTGLGKFLRPANFLGASAIALPAGFDADGMPIGIQALAPALGDGPLLSVAAAMAGVLADQEQHPNLSAWGL